MGICSKAGDAVSCWWLNQPTYVFLRDFFMMFRPSFFHGVSLGIPLGYLQGWWWVLTTNPSGFEVSPPLFGILPCGFLGIFHSFFGFRASLSRVCFYLVFPNKA